MSIDLDQWGHTCLACTIVDIKLQLMPEATETDRYRRIWDSSVRGAGIGVVSIGLQFAIRGFSTVALARLLLPEEFGLVAIAGIALNFFSRIADMGLTTASTQRDHMKSGELSTLFWVNTVGGILLCGIMIAIAPLMGAIFADRRVEHIVVALSLVLVVTGIGAQHESLLRRNLRYGQLAAIIPAAQAAGTAVGVTAAILGFGYWSIVAMNFVSRAAATVGYMICARWKPGRPNRLRSVRSFVRFGSHISGSQLLIYVTHNLDSIMVGLVGGAVDLGLYRRGFNLLQLPIEHFKAHMDRVIPSSLSRLQRNESEFSKLYRYGVSGLVFLGCPGIGLIFADAPALISLLLGDGWLDAVPYLRWLALAALISLLEVSIVWLVVPLAEGKKLLIVRFIRVVFVSVGMTIGLRSGPIGVAAGYGIGSAVSYIAEFIYTSVGRRRMVVATLGSIWQPIVSAALSAAVVIAIPRDISLFSVLLAAALYCTLYLGLFMILPGGHRILQSGRIAVVSVWLTLRRRATIGPTRRTE